MYKKTILRFAQSFIALPLIAINLPAYQPIVPTSLAYIPQSNMAVSSADAEKAKALDTAADKIDAYYKAHDMPLEGYGHKFVEEADKNGLDLYLVAAISVQESTGGLNACKKVKNSHLGYGSCKINFETTDKEIEIVSASLGGNNPNTAKHYDGKTTKEILQKYNPDYIHPGYWKEVMAKMNAIEGQDLITVSV